MSLSPRIDILDPTLPAGCKTKMVVLRAQQVFGLFGLFLFCNLLNLATCDAQYECTTLRAWVNHGFEGEDCNRARYDLMQMAEVRRSRRWEFLGWEIPATSDLPTARLPFKIRRS